MSNIGITMLQKLGIFDTHRTIHVRIGWSNLRTVQRSLFKAMIVRAVQSIPKGDQIRNFYSERPDDEYLLDYGFCMKPGENRESYLKFQKDDIARNLRKYFKISSQTIKENMFPTDELPFFLCYENGIIPQLEDLIGNILEHRDDQSLESSFNTTETVEIETLNFLCHFCSQRRRELDRLDQDFAKAKRFGSRYV